MPAKRHIAFKILSFLVLTDLLETVAQFFFKKSAIIGHPLQVFLSPFLWLALSSVLCIFIIWAVILSKIDLSVAVPIASFSYISVPLVSGLALGERISGQRWCGIFFILAGVIFVSLSTRHKAGNL